MSGLKQPLLSDSNKSSSTNTTNSLNNTSYTGSNAQSNGIGGRPPVYHPTTKDIPAGGLRSRTKPTPIATRQGLKPQAIGSTTSPLPVDGTGSNRMFGNEDIYSAGLYASTPLSVLPESSPLASAIKEASVGNIDSSSGTNNDKTPLLSSDAPASPSLLQVTSNGAAQAPESPLAMHPARYAPPPTSPKPVRSNSGPSRGDPRSALGVRTPDEKGKGGKGGSKLSTFMGVFVPACLGILGGVIIFLRLAWVIGQAGLLQFTLMGVIAFVVVLLTLLSFSAIASNGKMGGGGNYYLVSRTLGPEFGGSIGVIFYAANVAGCTFYLLGFTEALVFTFNLPDSPWHIYGYCAGACVVLAAICYIGADFFARTSLALLIYMFIALGMPILTMWLASPGHVEGFTGFDWDTLSNNLRSHYSLDADDGILYDFRAVFAIFFPSVTGIMAGTNMSGDLANPGESIPRGSFMATGVAACVFALLAMTIGGTIDNATLLDNKHILLDVALVPNVVAFGVFVATLSSGLAAIIGAARVLQALARDDIIPVLRPFAKGSKGDDEPRRGVILTTILVLLTLLGGSVNAMAPFITMFFLVSFTFVNFACFFLDISGAPNFRPTFKAFSSSSAFAGGALSAAIMVYLDPVSAGGAIVILFSLFWYIHFRAPPTSWGDISQALIYHQVRKYLLRLDARKDHIKYWRPQVLLLVSHPKTSLRLIDFVNNLKKGGLYVCGHVIQGSYADSFDKIEQNQQAWMDFIDVTGIKAFADITTAPSIVDGATNLALGSGLGFMKPNTVILGFHDHHPPLPHAAGSPAVRGVLEEFAPLREEAPSMSIKDYIQLLRNLHRMGKNVLVARNFQHLDKDMIVMTAQAIKKDQYTGGAESGLSAKTIDVWPMCERSWDDADATMSLVLLFGTILHKTDIWTKATRLRVCTAVETLGEVETERRRLKRLLYEFRIDAEIRVYALESADLPSYEALKMAADKARPASEAGKPFFGTLPRLERHAVLNELLILASSSTSVLFLPLFPLPDDNADDEACERYWKELAMLSANLGPTLLVNGLGERKIATEI